MSDHILLHQSQTSLAIQLREAPDSKQLPCHPWLNSLALQNKATTSFTFLFICSPSVNDH